MTDDVGKLVERLRYMALTFETDGHDEFATTTAAAADALQERVDSRKAPDMDALLSAIASCEAWIDRWTSHVGRCEGGDKCTCGRTAVLSEARAAIIE